MSKPKCQIKSKIQNPKLLFLLCALCASVVCLTSCVPARARKAVAQTNHERAQAQISLAEARETLANANAPTTCLEPVEVRLERMKALLDELEGAFPVDFTPTDDSYNQVHRQMVELREQMEQLRGLIAGLQDMVSKAFEKATGFSFPLGGSGEREGGLTAIILLVIGLIRQYSKTKTEKQEKEQVVQHFNVITGEVAEQQKRAPGSMDTLLAETKDKLTVKGMYESFEQMLDSSGNKTTRHTANPT